MATGKKRQGADKGGRPVRYRALRSLKQSHYQAVEFYMRGMSKKEAMIKAGYSPITADKAAWKVFGREDVQRAIEERRWKMRTRSHEMVDRIQEELARIAFFNIGELLEITDGGELLFNFESATMEEFAAIGEVTIESYTEGRGRLAREVKKVRVKPYNKKEALDSLARIYGMFHDNLNLTKEGDSIEEKLAKGRARVGQAVLEDEPLEGEYEEVEASRDTSSEDDM